jgi:acetate kinase
MILVLNCGSQTIKYKVFTNKLKEKQQGSVGNFRALKKELKGLEDIDLVGHRVVHGGDEFVKPVKITKDVLKKLKKYNKLAPLHNPHNLLGIKTAKKIFPEAEHWAVFDTEFFADLPFVSKYYALPDELRKKYPRYGFHGISHQYAHNKVCGKPGLPQRVVCCHLGGGCSISAIKNGKPIDTSMGFTPMEGLIMMGRAGDIDPGVVLTLGKKANKILNKESGMKGLTGEEEMLKILKKKNKKNKQALEMFAYRIKKYIGAYYAILGGCDVLVFTGAIGAGDSATRKLILKDLNILKPAHRQAGTKIAIVKPNEELAIAEKIYYNNK